MKKKNNKILKTTKMVWRYRCQVPFLKNGINPVGGFRENGFYTRATDGLTDDGRPHDGSSSDVQ